MDVTPRFGVNHVKLVVSLYYYVVLVYFFYLLDDDDYECNSNVSIGEKITKNLFCRLLECFIALRYQGYFTEKRLNHGCLG